MNNINQGIIKQEVARRKKWASWVIYWLDIDAVIYLEVIPQFFFLKTNLRYSYKIIVFLLLLVLLLGMGTVYLLWLYCF